MLCSFQLRKITWNAAVHQRLLGFIELSSNTAQPIKWCPTNEQRAISHSAGPCETARVLDGGLGCARSQHVTVSCKPSAVLDFAGPIFQYGREVVTGLRQACSSASPSWADRSLFVACYFLDCHLNRFFDLAQTRADKQTRACSQKQCEGSSELRDEGF